MSTLGPKPDMTVLENRQAVARDLINAIHELHTKLYRFQCFIDPIKGEIGQGVEDREGINEASRLLNEINGPDLSKISDLFMRLW